MDCEAELRPEKKEDKDGEFEATQGRGFSIYQR